MEVTAFRIALLTVMILLCAHNQEVDAAFLRIAPNRLQFFVYESVTLYCDGVFYCDVEHKSIGETPSCCTTNNTISRGPNCTIERVFQVDSGKYWCEEGGERSNIININVPSGSVILESPALPVMKGEDVTLSCRTKISSSNIQADFYKDGVHKWRSSTGNLIIKTVSMLDQGFYKCHISGVGESTQSWLSIGAGSVILESPALPVMEGEDVTLSCRTKESSSNIQADYYKDGVLKWRSSTGNVIIRNVFMSDQGFYKCHISGVGESPQSWLSVRVSGFSTVVTEDTEDHVDSNPDSSSSISAPWIIIAVLLTLFLLVVGLLISFGRFACTRGSVQANAAAPSQPIYATVSTTRKKNAAESRLHSVTRDPVDCDSYYSTVKLLSAH
ncbi:low affinity immunoglobulin gamma Fc region receptor II-like isoform X2 [Mugil cephalus]|uniref:low affinity immunoglobulin gamma Fc region receptor II-like isoform X2 n=1 Tax=Mugil cephalus TaxID=48193 RepID=UPI001FB812DF|nr:low affinity immunoglobulin gamma Fc region receptor II-like isoform X2 [Mugil cephalus]